jgi:hypothetical protein
MVSARKQALAVTASALALAGCGESVYEEDDVRAASPPPARP